MMLTAGASCPLFAVAEWCGTKPGDKSGNGPCRVEGPATPAAQPAWLAALKADRRATVARIGYRGGVFDTPELKWTQTAFVQPQMSVHRACVPDAHPDRDLGGDLGDSGVSSPLLCSPFNPVLPSHGCRHPFDLFFYDANSHNYTVSRYLDDVEARYGGIDGMLMWPTVSFHNVEVKVPAPTVVNGMSALPASPAADTPTPLSALPPRFS